jgi:hypothetical protein
MVCCHWAVSVFFSFPIRKEDQKQFPSTWNRLTPGTLTLVLSQPTLKRPVLLQHLPRYHTDPIGWRYQQVWPDWGGGVGVETQVYRKPQWDTCIAENGRKPHDDSKAWGISEIFRDPWSGICQRHPLQNKKWLVASATPTIKEEPMLLGLLEDSIFHTWEYCCIPYAGCQFLLGPRTG